MKLLEKTLSLIGFEKRSNNGDNYWDNFNALRTGAVTPQAAETLSTVSACVSAISETIGSLPLHLYKRTPEGRERNTEHSLARVLHDAPNERQSALEFREMMTAAMLLRGNAFALDLVLQRAARIVRPGLANWCDPAAQSRLGRRCGRRRHGHRNRSGRSGRRRRRDHWRGDRRDEAMCESAGI